MKMVKVKRFVYPSKIKLLAFYWDQGEHKWPLVLLYSIDLYNVQYVVCDYSQEPIMTLTRKPKRAPAITKTHFSKTLWLS